MNKKKNTLLIPSRQKLTYNKKMNSYYRIIAQDLPEQQCLKLSLKDVD